MLVPMVGRRSVVRVTAREPSADCGGKGRPAIAAVQRGCGPERVRLGPETVLDFNFASGGTAPHRGPWGTAQRMSEGDIALLDRSPPTTDFLLVWGLKVDLHTFKYQ